MELIPIMFDFERKHMLPILTVTGKCKNMPIIDSVLISKAVQIIEISQNQLNGKALELLGHEHDINIPNGMMAVRFYILFKTEEEYDKAIARFKKELG